MSQQAIITRVFDAPRETVWRYFTEPELFAAWFGTPPYTTPVETVAMDVRPGGEFRSTMVHEDDGTTMLFAGHYREVVPDERLVQRLENMDGPDDPNVEVFSTTLSDAGDGRTKVVYHQTGHMPPEQYAMVEQGVSGFYERLAGHLASL